MKVVRLGVIGCGGMAQSHMSYFDKVPRLKFVAAADVAKENLNKVVEKYGVEGYDDGHKLIASGKVDAVLIATPHYHHPTYAIAAMKKGLHVLCEKPVAVTAADAAKMIAAHKQAAKTKFGVMFQMRTSAKWRMVKKLIDAGEIGDIRRVTWIITVWFRPQSYYDSGTWRATWAGEGGGVLINQCPHNLDLLTWICGTPSLVDAHVQLGRDHRIEVEDEVNAYLEWPNGATGNFITSTGEAPGTDRLEIAGDLGKLVVERGNIIDVVKNHMPTSVFSKTTDKMFGKPGTDRVTYEPTGAGENHQAVTENFIAAILDGSDLIAPGEEGIHSLELGNAILMSGIQRQAIKIPTPRAAYEKMLKELIRKSTFKKGPAKKVQEVNMAVSFHK